MTFDGTIVFPHIAKTGGTSVSKHFREALPEGAFFVKGPLNRTVRLREGRPQFEALKGEELAQLRVVQGHGADQDVLLSIPPEHAKLMVVLRHPVSRYLSHFRHQDVVARNRGFSGRDDEGFNPRSQTDPLAKKLIKMFPAFVPDPEAPLMDQARAVLSCFDYVVVTENMSQQLKPVFTAMGLPDELGHRRISKTELEADRSASEIVAANQVDMALFEIFAEGEMDAEGRINPMGYDAEAKAAAVARLAGDAGYAKARADRARAELVKGLASKLCLEGALALLATEEGRTRVEEPDLLIRDLEEQWAQMEPTLNEHRRSEAARKSRVWLSGARKFGRTDADTDTGTGTAS